MNEATLRRLAKLLLADLTVVVPDPVQAEEIRAELRRLLDQPPGVSVAGGLRRILARREIRGWVRQQRGAGEDIPKSDGDEDAPVRYLCGQNPRRVRVGQVFPLEISIRRQPEGVAAPLAPFTVPPNGVTVTLALQADGLDVLDDQCQELFVPPGEEDSRTVLFRLLAPADRVYEPSVRVYIGGSPVGELSVRVTAGIESAASPVDVAAPIADLRPAPRELALDVVRVGDAYEYRLLGGGSADLTCHRRVPSGLVTRLHQELTRLAATREYDAAGARRHLEDLGLDLWKDGIPGGLRDALAGRVEAADSLSIVTDLHAVPWELLFPDPAGSAGRFLAERIPVVRRVTGQTYRRKLDLGRAAYVHPPTSPPDIAGELDAVRDILGARADHLPRISGFTELTDLVDGGAFELLHLACHNEFRDRGWDRVGLAGGSFTPLNLQRAKLAATSPLVFFNACRTTGGAVDTRLESWASGFLRAGAGAFVGTAWPVRTGTARRYAYSFYRALVDQHMSLGDASLFARRATQDDQDPSWLAYAVYGHASAALTRR
ncbi:hypothetical protein GCM10029964_061590 [Kibdelosporangium lantanae]